MMDQLRKVDTKKVDTGEFDFPETLYVRDIEDRVFQSIILQCLTTIEGVALVEGNFIDNILGRSGTEGVKGISVEQDSKTRAVNIRVDINVCFGVSIPEKAEEVQEKISKEITRVTGLHVGCVHVVFKDVVSKDTQARLRERQDPLTEPQAGRTSIEEEYSDEF